MASPPGLTRAVVRKRDRLDAVLARRQPDLTVMAENLHKPRTFSALIRTYVWGWAIEWVFFFVEIAAAKARHADRTNRVKAGSRARSKR